jgi:hypothetical protein
LYSGWTLDICQPPVFSHIGQSAVHTLFKRHWQGMDMDNQPNAFTDVTDDNNTPNGTPLNKLNNTRIVKIGSTTFEINHYYTGTLTYEEVVRNAIKREAENR